VNTQTGYNSCWAVFGIAPPNTHVPAGRPLKLITITCEVCGKRHHLERQRRDPEEFWLVCHECELSLRCVFEP
jgi:hypothetical protein